MCGLAHQSVLSGQASRYSCSESVDLLETCSRSGRRGSGVQGGAGSDPAGIVLVWSLDSCPCLRS